MLKRIDGYTMTVIAPNFALVEFHLDPLPPGTNVWANISLSNVNTLFEGNNPDPKFAVDAYIAYWTFYNPDGSESQPQPDGSVYFKNAVGVENCARIVFDLFGWRAAAIAQINIFSF